MRLLVFSHIYPPVSHANGKRPASVVRAALEQGWDVHVVTGTIGMPAGQAESETHPRLRITRVNDPVDRICRRFADNFRLYRSVRMFFHACAWPDQCVGWWLKAWRAAGAGREYERVLAFILPASVLLSAFPKRGVDRRWVFDYQEPVTPFLEQVPRRSPLQRLLLPALRRLERRALDKAGHVVFTTASNQQAYVEQGLVNKEKTVHIPYFYDERDFPPPAPKVESRFSIGYLGTFDWRGARSPETFLRALAGFLRRVPSARGHTRFLFRGTWLPEHTRFLDELNLHDLVSLQPPVGHADYINALRESPVLLLVVSAEHRLFMPSKIVDYFGARRPILAFTPRECEMRDVLCRAGMGAWIVDEGDHEGGARVLEQLWKLHRSGQPYEETGASAAWSARNQIPRYLRTLDTGITNPENPPE